MEKFTEKSSAAVTRRKASLAAAQDLLDMSYYKQTLAVHLPKHVFAPNRWRLLWFAGYTALAFALFFFILRPLTPWPLKLICGVMLGTCNALLAFLVHEIQHGSVIRNKRIQDVLGFFGFFPFFITPTFWKYVHNRFHHGKTQRLGEDPDAYPNLRVFRQSRFMKFMFPFSPGSGHKRSLSYFFFWFSFHNFATQAHLRFKSGIYDQLEHTKVTYEFAGQIALALVLLAYAGPSQWLWVLAIPLIVQNYLVMSYVSTNHNLSPLTKENDPLVNSLTVTNPPLIEFFHFNFGYHVEHHIFPSVNGKFAKLIHRELIRQFPDSFQFMPKRKAIAALYRTPRIYKNAFEFIHPETKVVSAVPAVSARRRALLDEPPAPLKDIRVPTPDTTAPPFHPTPQPIELTDSGAGVGL